MHSTFLLPRGGNVESYYPTGIPLFSSNIMLYHGGIEPNRSLPACDLLGNACMSTTTSLSSSTSRLAIGKQTYSTDPFVEFPAHFPNAVTPFALTLLQIIQLLCCSLTSIGLIG